MTTHVLCSPRRTGKRLQALFLYAAQFGWTISRTNGGHLRLSKPGRPLIHTSSTPSDWRAVRNALAMLARADRHVVIEDQKHPEVLLVHLTGWATV
ncbi:type II toxin-antitoxin system HicA family toxin [Pseudomonas citronellolis]|uniref:type II toxin-antitoxin system HicA family toxin n=1 Tax=Pseudomonas citronellolis TaxID=53408 RepID=UPI0023E3B85E|nr:type II toxin-antitoxin system HicA family toxin [Pseudomonas citronellolis]MDF3935320.1 type II toxin-antitoxin system HicA family toxin [Pseudomonas citronellolis]